MKTVGLFLADQVNEYFQLVQSDAEQTGRKHGLNVVVQFADGRAATQTKQIHAAITGPESARPVAIITAPVRDNSLNRLARQAIVPRALEQANGAAQAGGGHIRAVPGH